MTTDIGTNIFLSPEMTDENNKYNITTKNMRQHAAQQRKYPKRRADSEARTAAGAASVVAPEVGLGAGASAAAAFSTKEEAMTTTAIMATAKSLSLGPASIVDNIEVNEERRRLSLCV
ncbi:unnamed protein product [Musa acuminata subsp. burmannicoides]